MQFISSTPRTPEGRHNEIVQTSIVCHSLTDDPLWHSALSTQLSRFKPFAVAESSVECA